MSGTVKLVVIAAVVEMLLVAAGAVGWRVWMMGGLEPSHLRRAALLGLVPVMLLVPLRIYARRLASDTPRLSDSHRRYMESGLTSVAVLAVAAHGFMAWRFLVETPLNRDDVVRAAVVFVGVYVAVRGNFAAKLDPPTGAGAPPAGVWTRGVLNLGWLMVAMGVAVVVCAITLPLKAVMFAALAVGVLMAGMEVSLRRRFRAEI